MSTVAGYHQYCGRMDTFSRVGVASVMWRLFSTVNTISTVGDRFSTV